MFAPPTPNSIAEGALKICNTISTSNPFFIGRNGTIEVEVLYFWLVYRAENPYPYPFTLKKQLERNAGVFPATEESVDRWCEAYMKALGFLNGGAAGWYQPIVKKEMAILNGFARKDSFHTPLRSLEPYYMPVGQRWTERLRGRKVCIVSSFTDTIQKQIEKPIWTGDKEGLLSGIKWSFVRTGYAPSIAQGRAEWPTECSIWDLAVAHVTKEVAATGADIALIGCGGLGMVIAGKLREQGVSSFVLGGAIQVLFGIKGKRWVNHDVISRFWNDAWVWPSENEVPGAAAAIEGGCYW